MPLHHSSPADPLPLPLPLPQLTDRPTTHLHSCLSISRPLVAYLASAILYPQQQHQQQQQQQGGAAFSTLEPRRARNLEDSAGQTGGPVVAVVTGPTDVERGGEVDVLVLSVGSGAGVVEALLDRELRAEMGGMVREGMEVDTGLSEAGALGEGSRGGRACGGDEPRRGDWRGNLVRYGRARVFGVEVPSDYSDLNRYLPVERRVVVRGVWDVLDQAGVRELKLREREVEGESVDDEEKEEVVEEARRGVYGKDGNVRSGIEHNRHDVDVDVDGVGIDRGSTVVDTSVWLVFVYPRQMSLLEKYVDEWVGDQGVAALEGGEEGEDEENTTQRTQRMRLDGLIWAGPRADLEEYEAVFARLRRLRGWGAVQQAWGEEAGVREGEGVVFVGRC